MPTANTNAYPNDGWQQSAGGQAWSAPPWGNPQAPGWGHPPTWQSTWHPACLSRGASIAFTMLGFILWWPVGLAMLFYSLGSRRMGCFGHNRDEYRAQRAAWKERKAAFKAWARGEQAPTAAQSTSGNRAFDEYRAETLRRLEEEQQEFGSFLERLRFAKDKAEFDQFMAERRQTPRPPAPMGDAPHA